MRFSLLGTLSACASTRHTAKNSSLLGLLILLLPELLALIPTAGALTKEREPGAFNV